MATIIRRDQHLSAQAFSFADLERERQDHCEAAVAEAESLIAAARVEAERLKEEARLVGAAEGLTEGRAAGEEKGRQEANAAALAEFRKANASLLTAVTTALQKLNEEKHRLISTAESGLIQLAIAISERVCKLQASQSSDVALANAKRLIEMARHELDIELRVSQQDYAALQHVSPELARIGESATHVNVIADPSIEAGGVTLRSRHGTLDATIQTQLQRIAEALLPTAPITLPEAPADGAESDAP